MTATGQPHASVAVVVLAHNEQRRIGLCLESLPCGDPEYAIHVVVNGSSDGTAAIVARAAVRHDNLTLYDWAEPGKSRSWNRIVLGTLHAGFETVILVDGDAQVADGSFDALRAALGAHPEAQAASALPLNGRHVAHYRQLMLDTHGIFGDLYALRGTFVDRMRDSGIRLPMDLIGDDGLVGAMAKTNLGPLADWTEQGICPVVDAGFLCEPLAVMDWRSWRMQYRRMINYAVRHFQDLIITDILRNHGPEGLPQYLALLYPAYLGQFRPRSGIWAWFDRYALARMANQMEAAKAG